MDDVESTPDPQSVSQPEEPEPKKKPRRKRWWIVLGLFVVFAGFVYNFTTDVAPPDVPPPPLVVGTDGWDALVRAWQAVAPEDMEPIVLTDADFEEYGYDVSELTLSDCDLEVARKPQYRDVVRSWFQNEAEVERLIREALSHPVLGVGQSRFSEWVRILRWVNLRTGLAIDDGDAARALELIDVQYRLCEKFRRGQFTFLRALVAGAARMSGNEFIDELLCSELDVDWTSVQRLLGANRPSRQQYRKAVLGDYHHSTGQMTDLIAEGGYDLLTDSIPKWCFKSTWVVNHAFFKPNLFRRHAWRVYEPLLGRWQHPLTVTPDPRASQLRVFASWLNGNRLGLEYAGVLVDGAVEVMKRYRRYRSQHGATELAVAIRIYQLAHGSYPDDIDSLKLDPAILFDAATGETYVWDPDALTVEHSRELHAPYDERHFVTLSLVEPRGVELPEVK